MTCGGLRKVIHQIVICQSLFISCPQGMQVRGMVNLKLHLLMQSELSSISHAFRPSQDQIFQCFVCIKPANWNNSMYSTSLSWYCRQRAQVLERTWIYFLLHFLVWAGMDYVLLLRNSPPIFHSLCSVLNFEAEFNVTLLFVDSISSFQIPLTFMYLSTHLII